MTGVHFYTKNISKIRVYGFALLIIFTSIITPFTIYQQVNAANKVSGMSLTDQTTSWYYWRSIKRCLDVHDYWLYGADKIESGQWFRNGGEEGYYRGYYGSDLISVVGSDGGATCEGGDNELLTTAFNFWGIDDPLYLICGSKGTSDDDILSRADNQDCYAGTNNFDRLNSKIDGEILNDKSLYVSNPGPAWNNRTSLIMQRIGNEVYGGNSAPDSLSNEMRYVYYYRTFMNGCTDGASVYTRKLTGDNVYKISVWDGDSSKMVDGYVQGDKESGEDVYTWASGETMKCGELATAIEPNSTLAKAYSAYQLQQIDSGKEPDFSGNAPATDTETTSTCTIEGVGWIVCPVLNFIAELNDGMYGAISSWLDINNDVITDSSLENGWSAIRDIANAVMVIVFLILIFSQLTSVGISNYGIKKMLPRLVIMVILVNLSFIVTRLAVDVSNILGSSIYDLLGNSEVFEASNVGSHSGSIAGALLAGGTTLSATLAGVAVVSANAGRGLLIMILLSGLFSIGITFLILAVRQAVVLILIVFSPLAFVAMILPNTNQYYEKWKKLFISMLTLYPMVSVLFGISAMAADIIVKTDTLLGLAIATIPLFATIPLVKASLNTIPIVGGALGKLSKMNPFAGGVKRSAAAGAQKFKSDMGNRVRAAALNGRFGRIGERMASGKSRRSRGSETLAADVSRAEDEYVVKNDGKYSTREVNAARARIERRGEEEVKDRIASIENEHSPDVLLDKSEDGLKAAIREGNAMDVRAYSAILARSGPGRSKLRKVISEMSGEMDRKDSTGRTSLHAALGAGMSSVPDLRSKDADLDSFVYDKNYRMPADGPSLDPEVKPAVSKLSLSAKASQDTDAFKQALRYGAINADEARSMIDPSNAASGSLTEEKRQLLQQHFGDELTISHQGGGQPNTPSTGQSAGGQTVEFVVARGDGTPVRTINMSAPPNNPGSTPPTNTPPTNP